MSNPLKKTMVFLGLAEEEYDDLTGEVFDTSVERVEPREVASSAPVTPLRRVAQPTVARGAMNEILTVHPTEYRDAPTVAESFREGIPVIINLSRMTETDAKRMIDFASGLALGLNGKFERVTNKVFLLSPEHIAVSSEENPQPVESNTPSFFVSQQ